MRLAAWNRRSRMPLRAFALNLAPGTEDPKGPKGPKGPGQGPGPRALGPEALRGLIDRPY